MDARYNHLQEDHIYQLWEESGLFDPDNLPNTTNGQFSIIMPPPNANDPLHIGHGMVMAIEDAMVRFHRMWGDKTLWLPGTDHAGIETQYVFEKKLAKEGKSRFNFDRKTLFDHIWQYVHENSDTAIDQIKRLGASADWSRFRFTLDPKVVEFVLQTFQKLHDDGLIYRDLKLVNYCTKCGTSYSELEIEHIDQVSPLYYVKYQLANGDGEYVTVATVRPEPIFVDTHLAVNPNDKTKAHLIGQKAINPLTQAEMEIIADEMVDPEFGTGVVKITPAHDQHDYEVAKKHNLPIAPAIDTKGKILANGGKYAGLSVVEARKQVVADLQAADLIDKIDQSYSNRVGVCYRCHRPIEPLPLPQFFIKVRDEKNNLVDAALAALKNQETVVQGAGYDKILRHWLENLRDWNISRQIVWGIGIPVWYAYQGHEQDISVSFVDKSGNYQVGHLDEMLQTNTIEEIKNGLQQIVAPTSVPYQVSVNQPADSKDYLPETDTLDTWFSSSQWPVVTLKTNRPKDFDTFYPTSVMETAYDILPFWVMRMMLLGLYLTGKSPFSTVYLNGLIRDQKGQKMSKSKGNVVNPLEIIERYGADALRMALTIRSTPGLDKSVSEGDFKAMRNFANKIWNAARFVQMLNSAEPADHDTSINSDESTKKTVSTSQNNLASQVESKLGVEPTSNKSSVNAKLAPETKPNDDLDDKTSQHLRDVVQMVTDNMHKNQLGIAADTVYNEFWHWYCDQCIEEAKRGKISTRHMTEGLIVFLKLIHPFMPYVTEAIWQELYKQKTVKESLLMGASWPK